MKEKKENGKENITGGDYLALGLYAFTGLGMEALYAYLLEPILYGTPMQDWSNTQVITHWIITCITWGMFAFILIKKSGEKYRFRLLNKGNPMRLWQYGLCVLFILFAFGVDYIVWDGFKVYLEYVNKGLILFAFQYIYYAFETMLFMLIIVFGQKACEVCFHNEIIPYGGIICGLTWGLAHIFTKNLLTGLLGIVLGFAMGSVYLLVNRDLKKTYVVLFFMFVI